MRKTKKEKVILRRLHTALMLSNAAYAVRHAISQEKILPKIKMATLQLMSSQNELTGVAQSHKNLVFKTQLHLKSQQY